VQASAEEIIGRVLFRLVRKVRRANSRRHLDLRAWIDVAERHCSVRLGTRHFDFSARLLQAIVIVVAIARLNTRRNFPIGRGRA
jgi:hypothetical protein